MMQTISSSTKFAQSTQLFEFAPGKRAAWSTLEIMLPDVEHALFFAKVYKLNRARLHQLLDTLFNLPLLKVLTEGGHSTELQEYLITVVPDMEELQGTQLWVPTQGQEYLLSSMWKDFEVVIAKSIQEVADTLGSTLDSMPSMYGRMTFQHLNKLNKRRPTIGTFAAEITHARMPKNLVILDDSGSMTERTIKAIADDVVALSYAAQATMALVSNTCRVFQPGTFNTQDILEATEYSGTHYETLTELLDEDWDVVITIADYDSSSYAKAHLKQHSKGHISKVLDLSLVNQPSYLAQCVGQFADRVEPLLIGNSDRPL